MAQLLVLLVLTKNLTIGLRRHLLPDSGNGTVVSGAKVTSNMISNMQYGVELSQIDDCYQAKGVINYHRYQHQ